MTPEYRREFTPVERACLNLVDTYRLKAERFDYHLSARPNPEKAQSIDVFFSNESLLTAVFNKKHPEGNPKRQEKAKKILPATFLDRGIEYAIANIKFFPIEKTPEYESY